MAKYTDRHMEMARDASFTLGMVDFGSIKARRVFAQAIADAEDRGTPGAQRRAWREGYLQRDSESDERITEEYLSKSNPYPAPEPEDR